MIYVLLLPEVNLLENINFFSEISRINFFNEFSRINFFSEFSRLKKAITKEWYVQLSEEKSVKTTINIKKENIISAGD